MERIEKNNKKIIYNISFIIFLFVVIVLCLFSFSTNTVIKGKVKNYFATRVDADKMVYLSDIDYVEKIKDSEDKSFETYVEPGYHYRKDKNGNSQMISVNVNGKKNYYIKGVSAWASSNVIYDLSALSTSYDKFQAYIGIDASSISTDYNSGANITVYTLKEGETQWKQVYNTNTLKGWNDAKYVDIDIKDVKYLRLYAYENGDSWYSMWHDDVVYADAKLVKDGYEPKNQVFDIVKEVSYYDDIIKGKDNYNIAEYEKILLQREFVNNVGYDILQALMNYDKCYEDVVTWLMEDVDTLRLFLLGGEPDGNYATSLKILNDLRTEYADDLNNTETTKNNVKFNELYKKMMVALSLTHSQSVGSWVTGAPEDQDDPNGSNPLNRYKIFKDFHLAQNSSYSTSTTMNSFDTKIFESLSVEEMRFVMNNIISDDEMKWLNYYSTYIKKSMNPYDYIRYTDGYNYNKQDYYLPENQKKWEEKYYLNQDSFQVKYGMPRLWMVFEEGSVCGGLSKTGSNLWGVHGVPSSVVSQPGHAAYIFMQLDSKGRKIWNLGNDVDNWGYSGKTEKLSTRMPLGWGTGSYVGKYPASYVLLAQAALDDTTGDRDTRGNVTISNYESSEELLYLAKVYKDNPEKLEQIYRKAIDRQKLNFDAWLGLVNLYANTERTQTEYLKLVKDVIDALNYYPLPMHDLIRIIEPKLEVVNHAYYQIMFDEALDRAQKATEENVLQPSPCIRVAQYLAGSNDTTVANFSFDGNEDTKGYIKLADKYSDGGVTWQYTVDGISTNKDGTRSGTWSKNIHTPTYKLSDEEIARINTENGISIRIVGAMETIYNIPINKGKLPLNLCANDLENRFIGVNTTLQWRENKDQEWTYFNEKEPNLKGDKKIYVRTGATGTNLASDEEEFDFTSDGEKLDHYYIPLSRISVVGFSSEEKSKNNGVENLLDGSLNTIWHNLWDGSDTKKYIIFKLERPAYIDAIEYVPRQDGGNGTITKAKISVSYDTELNENTKWTTAIESTNWANNIAPKREELNVNNPVSYIKIEALSSVGNFMSATMFNFFEDNTKYDLPAVEIDYSTHIATNKPVTATLKLADANFEDENSGIDEDTLISDVLVLTDKDGNKLPDGADKFEYEFTQSGEHHFYYASKADYEAYLDGKMQFNEIERGQITAKVDWLVTGVPPTTFEYSTTLKTNKDVTVKLVSKDADRGIIITNNNNSDTYTFNDNSSFTFEFIDRYGNEGTATATVNNIDRVAPQGYISYSTQNSTTGSVKAKLVANEKVIILNNGGKDTYTFDKNGTFEFTYTDEAGNMNTTVANVNWIKAKATNNTATSQNNSATSKAQNNYSGQSLNSTNNQLNNLNDTVENSISNSADDSKEITKNETEEITENEKQESEVEKNNLIDDEETNGVKVTSKEKSNIPVIVIFVVMAVVLIGIVVAIVKVARR